MWFGGENAGCGMLDAIRPLAALIGMQRRAVNAVGFCGRQVQPGNQDGSAETSGDALGADRVVTGRHSRSIASREARQRRRHLGPLRLAVDMGQ